MISFGVLVALWWFYCAYVVLGGVYCIFKKEKEELKEFLLGVFYFPSLVLSFVAITFLLSVISNSNDVGQALSLVMLEGVHIFVLVPSVLLAFVLLLPFYTLLEKLMPE
ncbi:hypothetical protein ACPV5L_01645 [Vibrio astriarenae]